VTSIGSKAKYSLRTDIFRCFTGNRHSSWHFESVALHHVDAGMMHNDRRRLRAAFRE
jgi:hypothetical protein